jgi:hypothetical protein
MMDFMTRKTGNYSFAVNKAIRYELAENTCGKKTATHTAPVLVTECVAVVARAHPEFTEETLRDFVEESFREGEKRFEIEGGTIRALLPSRERAEFGDEFSVADGGFGRPVKERIADGVLVLKSKEMVEDIVGRECGLLDEKVYSMIRTALGDENLRDVGTDTDKVTILTRMTLQDAVHALLEEFDGILEKDAAEMCFEYKDPSIVGESEPPVLRTASAAGNAATKTRLLSVLHNSASYKSNVEKKAAEEAQNK